MKRFPPLAGMDFSLLVAFLHFGILAVESQTIVFTIDKVVLRAEPAETKGGDNLTLTCTAEISKAPGATTLLSQFIFYKEDLQLYNTSSAKDEAVYLISPARFSHSGSYSCAVLVNDKLQKSEDLLIKVEGVSRPNLNVSKNEVKEGEEVTVRCEALEEKPPITFKFFKIQNNKEKLMKTRLVTSINFAEVVFPVEEGDKILQFECTAEISSVFARETSQTSFRKLVTVTERLTTPTIRVSPSTNITEGDRLKVDCAAVFSHIFKSQPIEILIQKDKTILANEKDKQYASYSKDVAVIADEGNYTCKAESEKVSKSSSVYIHVTELFPRPTLNSMWKEFSEGDSLSFVCHITGFKAENLTFFLEKMNSTFISRMRSGGKYSKRTTESDSGSYVCRVTIRNITKKSEPSMITVYAPVSRPVLDHATNVLEVVVGQILTLTCRSEKGTPPITYTLFRGAERLDNFTAKAKGEAAVFKLNVTTLLHLGGYRCMAENRNRETNIWSNILNFTAIVPVQRTVLRMIPSSGEVENGKDLTLICFIINGSWPVEFRFYHKDDVNHFHQEILNKSNSNWHKGTVSKDQEGSYYCTATNKANCIRSNIVEIKVILASWKKAVIAVFVVLISLGILTALIWWYLQKKKKAKHMTLEMSRPAAVTSSFNEKPPPGQNNEAESHYVSAPTFNEDGENHAIKAAEEKKGLDQSNNEVQYAEVQLSMPDPHRAAVKKETETVYSELSKAKHDAGEKNDS
ncbi:platelet endothelial cell adhesion molecule isoform X2 [Rhinatrema bivittatum]|nr:platelet endothelial cell adhesion molecule isoform X2 [Rhinatrema bivittatum]